ncbi:hypothetical protein Tco_0731976 [Tanacetum coccineum]
MNRKSYSFDMETFRNMLLICPKLPGQKFIDPPFKEEILTFIRELGYHGNIKLLYDVKVDTAQILWGLYHQEKVDYVYLPWEDLVFQIKNKEFIPQHEVVQRYGVILLDYLTNLAMKESEAYKIYHDLTSRKVQPKPKYVRRSSRTKTDEAPKPSSGKRVKTTAKVAKNGVSPGVLDAPTCQFDDEEISCKSSDEDDDDEVDVSKHEDDDDDKRIESDNDGEDFVHPKFLTHDVESRQEEVNEEYSFDPMVQTPSYVELTNDGNSDEEVQGANIEEEEIVEEAKHEEDEANEL